MLFKSEEQCDRPNLKIIFSQSFFEKRFDYDDIYIYLLSLFIMAYSATI